MDNFILIGSAILGTLLAIAGIFGIYSAFKNGRNTNLANIQQQAITALQTQISSLKDKITELEKENALQGHLIELITSALKKKGMIVTIDGDMITISGKDGSSTVVKQQATKPKQTKITKAVSVTTESESN